MYNYKTQGQHQAEKDQAFILGLFLGFALGFALACLTTFLWLTRGGF